MKDFFIGICFMIVGVILSIALKVMAVDTVWTYTPIILIFIGGGFQINAFMKPKREMDEMNKKFKSRSGL